MPANQSSDHRDEWTKVARAADVPPGTMHEASLMRRAIVVANLGERWVAFPNACLHYNVRLSEGTFDGCIVTCRWHQWQYDLRTGDILTDESPYATMLTFPVVEQDGELFVRHLPMTRITSRPAEELVERAGS